jgi:hypothetical protein
MSQASYPTRLETSLFPPFEALLVFMMKGTFPAKWKQIDIPGNKQRLSRVCENKGTKTSPNLSHTKNLDYMIIGLQMTFAELTVGYFSTSFLPF